MNRRLDGMARTGQQQRRPPMTATGGRTMSPTQAAVLEWLLAYPQVFVTANLSGSMVGWSHWWASERARQHMMGVLPMLGIDASKAEPRARPLGGTPRITRPTFGVLNRSGWLRMVRHNRFCASYTISRAGILALRGMAS